MNTISSSLRSRAQKFIAISGVADYDSPTVTTSLPSQGYPLLGQKASADKLAHFERLDVVPVVNSHLGIIKRDSTNQPGFDEPPPARTVLSSNSMTVCLDLLCSSDAILGYPLPARSFFEDRDVAMLENDLPVITSDIGMYSVQEHAQHSGNLQIKSRIRRGVESVIDSGIEGLSRLRVG